MSGLRRILAIALVLVVGAVVAPVAATPSNQSSPAVGSGSDRPLELRTAENETAREEPQIAGVYPNPVADEDRGEFVVVDVPPETRLGRYDLSDEDGALSFANGTATGRIAVSPEPTVVRNLTDLRVVEAAGSVALANGGDRLRLAAGNETVASARYREAPEGQIGWYDDRGTLAWEPLGTTDRPVVSATGGTARAFVLPDAPDVALDVIEDAERRILLAGYTFSSRRVANALERAVERGVDVHVLLEGNPVDGITGRQARILDSLVESGVRVDLLGGSHGRYAFHHPKYAVVDDRAVVLTENWKPSGTGGRSNRGWGAVVRQQPIVEGLVGTFEADVDWLGARPWRQVRRGRTFEAGTASNGSYPASHDPERVPVERTRLLVAPDNAGDAVVDALDGATDSIDVIQMSIDGPDQRFLRATIRAARRGVDVRILVSGAWYVEEENRRLVERLRDRAETEDLPLEAKLATPNGRFEKIHAKGVVMDGDSVLVGSLNWNGESVASNREVLLQLDGEAVGSYYGSVFEGDWSGGEGSGSPLPIPVGIAAAIAGCVALAILVARRIDFGENVGVGPE